MKINKYLIVTATCLVAQIGSARAQPSDVAPEIDYGAVIARSRAMVVDTMSAQKWPGLSVAVSVDGVPVWAEGFGFADLESRVPVRPTTRFRVGSISKPMTALAAAQLYVEGRLDLDAPVWAYVPSFPEKRWPVTTRHLGGHLGGIRTYVGDEFYSSENYPTVLDGLKMFQADTLMHEPGTKYLYSSHGWNLLSAVVEGAAGRPFLEYMQEQIFDPIGMVHTTADHVDSLIAYRIRPYIKTEGGRILNGPFVDNSYKWAGGGFLSTSLDLLRFGHAHFDSDIVTDEMRELLYTEQQTTEGQNVGYGFGWFIGEDSKDRLVHQHGGGSVGGTSAFRISPEADVVFVMLVNLSEARLAPLAGKVFEAFVDEALEAQAQ